MVTKEKEQINYLENIDYEEYFLLKGCNNVVKYADYKEAQKSKQGEAPAAARQIEQESNSIRLCNS